MRSGRTPPYKLFATTAAGLEEVLADELRSLGARGVEPGARGVAFAGDKAMVYRANLCLRTAHRVLLELCRFGARDRYELYEGVARVDWSEHLTVQGTLAVDAVSSRSELDHTQFISRVVKDAVVDQFRKREGVRPDVDPRDPVLQLNARLNGNRCTLSIDTSGERLHRRGYRPTFGIQAPLKETLAAGVLLLAGYDGTGPLIDPMCGSGTFLVEASLIARNIPPGLLGRRFAFMRHASFDRALWRSLKEDARSRVERSAEAPISGSDISGEAIRVARSAAQGAGTDDLIRMRRAALEDLEPRGEGLLVTNPPYGERLGEMETLADLYGSLGDVLKQRCRGMDACVLTGSRFLAGKIGLRPRRRDPLWNGPIECRLLHFKIF